MLFSVLVECNFSTEQTICLVANSRDQLVPFGKRPSLGTDKDVERLNPSRLPIVKCCPVILSCCERESVELLSSRSINRSTSHADLNAKSRYRWLDVTGMSILEVRSICIHFVVLTVLVPVLTSCMLHCGSTDQIDTHSPCSTHHYSSSNFMCYMILFI